MKHLHDDAHDDDDGDDDDDDTADLKMLKTRKRKIDFTTAVVYEEPFAEAFWKSKGSNRLETTRNNRKTTQMFYEL